MGIFDLFKSKPPKAGSSSPAPSDKTLTRIAKIVGDRHAQNYDRMDAIESLCKAPSAESAAALLQRFKFHIDPSITDQEEKEAAMAGVVAAGTAALEPIRVFCSRAESLSWPLKILRELIPVEQFGSELVALLAHFDTEYTRNVEPKSQLIAELESQKSREARLTLERFLEDVNESIRFVATGSVLAQDDPESVVPLAKMVIGEESVRVKMRAAEGLAARGWTVPEEVRDALAKALPAGVSIDSIGKLARR